MPMFTRSRCTHRRYLRAPTTLTAATVLVLSPGAAIAGAVPAPGGPAAQPGHAGTHRVTLLTGDVVVYDEDTAGHRTARVEPAARIGQPPPTFQITTTADGLEVYPSDALPFVGRGQLGRDLFNVTALVRDGRDDASSATIPVITGYGDPAPLPATTLESRARPLPQTERHLPLTTLNSVGMQVRKAGTAEFWRSLATHDARGEPVLQQGISRVVADKRVRVSQDRGTSGTAQIGAPAAWRSGLTGAGTTIAVVDTGLDENHPDLKGKTVAAADFSGEGDTVDRHGHGTHVASIAAGTGAASGGRFKGVAPDAKLMVAKVFGADGQGDTAQVIAGVDWAVAQGAKIVNLSLGAGVTDGSDPLSQEIDRLSAKSGTLFVVAAGNAGSGDRTVTSPGAATSALTVGAVDGKNALASFSSRGPRLGDALVKPEITAPGVDITAARAAGTSMGDPVDADYTSASGTSMATPYVTGSAAVLLQQHPDLSGETLKNLVVTTAKDAGLRWYEQGAGVVDVGKAVTRTVIGPAVTSFGRTERDQRATAPVTRELTYANNGDQPLALELGLSARAWDGKTAADGIKLDTTSVTIPPRSTKTVHLTDYPDTGPAGVYGGTVVATTADKATAVRTPISTYNAPPLYPVTLRMFDSTGGPAQLASAQLIDDSAGAANRNDPFLDLISRPADLVNGVARFSVPAGTYSALGWTYERGPKVRQWSGLSASELRVPATSEIRLSAVDTVPARLVTPAPTDQRDRTVMLRRVLPPGPGTSGYIGESGFVTSNGDFDVHVAPVAGTARGAISLQDTATLAQSAVELTAEGLRSGALTTAYDVPTLTAKWPGDRSLPVVFGESGRPEDLAKLDVKGKAVLARIPVPADATDVLGELTAGAANAARAAAGAGAAALLPYPGVPGGLAIPGLGSSALPILSPDWEQGESLRTTGSVSLHLRVRAAPDAMYNLSYLDANGVSKDHVRQVDPKTLVATKTSYHADRPGLSGQKTWYPFPEGLWKTQPVQGTQIPVPGTWTEYTGPADDRMIWKRVVTLSGSDKAGKRASLAMNQQDIYRSGERARPDEHWFGAALRSAAVELQPDHPARYPATAAGWQVACSLCRGGDDPDLFVPAMQWVDGFGGAGHFTSPYENARYFATATTRLYRDGTEIPQSNKDDPLALVPLYRLAPEKATYRLDVTDVLSPKAEIGAPSTTLFQYGSRTDTSWTFTSARSASPVPAGFACYPAGTACSFQPLIQLDYRLPLDVTNRAFTGTAFTFDVAAAGHSGSRGGPVTGLKVSSSADGGKTWTEAPAKPRGNGVWSVTVTHPASAGADGSVWLRAEARDASGNTVTQTVQRAYGLTAPLAAVSSRAR
ncbi:S8 family serine peptidase [Amycolatopsis sp. NPDC059021]|uniref:S8 family peptidase n=1 Tax=Amycolatopsis sp. NPDC059021 TaxID=3346704 RepID=UPI00366ECD68